MLLQGVPRYNCASAFGSKQGRPLGRLTIRLLVILQPANLHSDARTSSLALA